MHRKNPFRLKTLLAGVTLTVATTGFAGDLSPLLGKDLHKDRNLLESTMRGRNYMVRVDQDDKIQQVVDSGANGSGVDPLPGAANTSSDADSNTSGLVELPVNYQGQEAIDRLGADLPKVAASYGLEAGKLRDLLLSDDTIRIDSDNRLFYVDHDAGHSGDDEPDVAGTTTNGTGATSSNAVIPIAEGAQLANTFKLHSKPGSNKTLYLNFVGFTASNTAWGSGNIVAPAYDLNGNPADFDNNERSNIISIWHRVAEDFVAFDVDVTTEPPTPDALFRTSWADPTYGVQVVITKSGTINCKCGGVAYVGVASMINNARFQPAWVFQQSLANNEKYIAEAASHEAGHNLGLFHDGHGTSTAYYSGHGSGETGWAPIMGAGYYKNVTQWSAGAYPNANTQQDDIATMATHGFVARTDDVGNTFQTAVALAKTTSGDSTTVNAFGVIEKADDVDMYTIDTTGGVLNLTASPARTGPNLDTQLTLYNAGGSVLAFSAPQSSLQSTIMTSLPAGTYYLAVTNSARAQNGADPGYPLYGTLGQYRITGTFPTVNIQASAPNAVISASTLTGPAALTVNFSANSSQGNGNITSYRWTFGDGASSTSANPVHVYNNAGTYTATLTVQNQYNLTHSTSVNIVVSAAPAQTTQIGATAMALSVSKTTRSTVVLRVVDGQGHPVPNATVTGTWSGAFSGKTVSKTAKSGLTTQSSNASKIRRGGSGTYTVNSIAAPGYVYNPTRNVRSVVTVTW